MSTKSRKEQNNALYGNNFESRRRVPQYAYSPEETELKRMERMKEEWLKNNKVKVLN
jgi:hypothetical protein